MIKRDEEFLARLLATFKIEALEHIHKITDGLLMLEKASGEEQSKVMEEVYREFHSLKGAARAVNLIDIEAVCQSLEGVFSMLKKNQITLSAGTFDLFHKSIDSISEYLNTTDNERLNELRAILADNKGSLFELIYSAKESLSRQNTSIVKGDKSEGKESTQVNLTVNGSQTYKTPDLKRMTGEKPGSSDTIRIIGNKLDKLLLQVEELLNVKLTTSQHVNELLEVHSKLNAWQKEWKKNQSDLRTIKTKQNSESITLTGKEINAFIKLMNFYDWNHSQITAIDNKVNSLLKTFRHDNRNLGGMVDNLLDEIKEIMMHPVSSLFNVFPKMVRDLGNDLGKQVDLEILGGEIEIDRRILDEMKDAFIHIIRNSVDHGIEKPDERTKLRKNPRGNIKILVERLGGSEVSVCIQDDGRGIDIARVKKDAVMKKILTEEEVNLLSEDAALKLIFRSDLSTSPVITDISGRGLGLAIVQEKVDKVNGLVQVNTKLGEGTCFRIHLPLTLATFRGILLTVSNQYFIVPTIDVDRIRRVPIEEIKTVENKETILYNGRPISLVKLHDILGIKYTPESNQQFITVVIIQNLEKKIAFAVDEIINEQEILVKPFNKQLTRVRNISGATILGSGKVVPILNASDLLRSAERSSSSLISRQDSSNQTGGDSNSVLVVDDSITSRMLIKDILETAGYKVTTTIDGMEAFTALKTEKFDIVVSDVEMPRMTGFELTSKIRAEEKLSDIPVVLVTALASQEDREKGIDAGANAYIVKSDFDQSNLLEIIKRLV